MSHSWHDVLGPEKQKPYFQALIQKVDAERAAGKTIYPAQEEVFSALKATPLAATITVFEVYGVGSIVRQETYRIYEPLLFVALIYLCLTFVLVIAFRLMERRMPQRSA